MPWVYLDDGFPDHPKTAAAGGDAGWLFVCILAYCRRFLTGGRVPKDAIGRLTDRRRPVDLAMRLVEVGYLEDAGDYFVVHDYQDWNASEEAQRQRRQEKARKAAGAKWDKVRKEKERSARSNAQALPEQMPEQMPEQCSTDAIPQPHNPSISSLSDLRRSRGTPVEIEKSETGKAASLTAQAVAVLGPAANGSSTPGCRSVVSWGLEHLDARVLDEILGYCGTLDVPPRTPGYLATTIRQHAAQRGVDMPPWQPR